MVAHCSKPKFCQTASYAFQDAAFLTTKLYTLEGNITLQVLLFLKLCSSLSHYFFLFLVLVVECSSENFVTTVLLPFVVLSCVFLVNLFFIPPAYHFSPNLSCIKFCIYLFLSFFISSLLGGGRNGQQPDPSNYARQQKTTSVF